MSRTISGRVMRLFFSVCLLCLVAGAATAAVWTVEPDGSGDFPTIQAAVDAAADGDTIELGDGVFSGPGNWDIAMVGRNLNVRSISGDPTACKIDCFEGPEAHRGLVVDGGTPRIEGLEIRYGRAVVGGGILVTGGDPRFTNCRIVFCEASDTGGGVHVDPGAAPVFTSCGVWNNEAGLLGGGVYLASGSDAALDGCDIGQNHTDGDGGGIAVLADTGRLLACNMSLNTAQSEGGGIYVAGSSNFAIEDTSLNFNVAMRGGGIAMTGGAIATVDGGYMSFNEGLDRGGVIFCSATASPTFSGSTLVYNTSPSGAAVHVESLALPQFLNMLIIYNQGEAVTSDGSATASFECCDLFGNWGGDWTGAIAGQLGVDNNINLDPLITLPRANQTYLTPGSPCAAENNPACGQIGFQGMIDAVPVYEVRTYAPSMLPTLQAAIDLAPAGAEVRAGGTFQGDGNRDLDFGGKDLLLDGGRYSVPCVIDCEGSQADPHRAFIFQNGETPAAEVKNLTIRNAHDASGYGGGGMRIADGSSPTIRGVRFEGCVSQTAGGGILVQGDLSGPAIIGCVFEGNQAGTAGGGLATLYGTSALIQHCEITGNTAATTGGGMYLFGTLQDTLRSCSFQLNATMGSGGGLKLRRVAVLDSCDFSNNSAATGGGMLIDHGGVAGPNDVVIQRCSFESNTADTGGAVADPSPGEVLFLETDFRYNSAGTGGAYHVSGVSSRQFVDVVFEGNIAENEGGGVYQGPTVGLLQFEGCTFDSNEITGTAGQGAGLWLVGEAYLSECLLEGNVTAAAGRGGGLHLETGAAVGLEICTLRGNHATFGGALHALQATLTLDSCQIQDNTASYAAAAFLDGDLGSTFDFCTFLDNTATSTGGAVICDNSSSPLLRYCSLVGNTTGTYGAHLVSWHGSLPAVENSILAFAPQGTAVGVGQDGGVPYFNCSDIYGNAGGDWVGDIAPQIHDDNNFSADPLFCDLAARELTLFDISPCVPENSNCNQLVGAWGQGCIDPNTGVADDLPAALALDRPAPNPFNPSTTISFALPTAAGVELTVHDARGHCVRRLVRGETYPAGRHDLRWNGADDAGRRVGSGVYLFRLRAGGELLVSKGVLIK